MTERIKQMTIVKNIYPGIDFPHFSLVVCRVLVLDDTDNIVPFAPKDSPVPGRILKVGSKDGCDGVFFTVD